MESITSPGVVPPESSLDFSFGFDDVNFSDRTLLIEIIDDDDEAGSEDNPDDNHSHWLENLNRRHDNHFNNASAPRVKTLHINSLILAAKSPFFRKLFSNGMRESEQRHVTLRIEASEEVPFTDLLNYIYSNNLPTTQNALLNLLVTADKFEVDSCVKYCCRLLLNLPMTCESALLCLDLPSSLSTSDTVQPLIDAAKQFLASRFKKVHRYKKEFLNLTLAGIQAVLSSGCLQVASACDVYDIVLTWARKHYPNLEERREILRTQLLGLVHFPSMTCAKLLQVLACSDIDHELASEVVIHALHFKAETPYRQRRLAAEKGNAVTHQFAERAPKFQPVKVIDFESPHQQCITVYLDLKREEVARIFPGGHICTESFHHLGGQELVLVGICILGKQTSVHSFGLILLMKMEVGSAACTVNYDIALRSKPLEEFVSKWKGSQTFTGGRGWTACSDKPIAAPWTDFIDDNSPYLINGTLHLRADLTIKK